MRKLRRNIVSAALIAMVLSVVGGCGSNSNTTTLGNANIFYSSSVFLNGTTAKGVGYNGFGQFGDGTTTSRTVVTPIARPAIFNGLQLGGYHSLAFGTYSAWSAGGNTYGQLGRVTATTQDTAFQPVNFKAYSTVSGKPATSPFHKKIVAIAAGGNHNLLVNDTGEVWSWGANGSGQLGNGTFAGSTNTSVGMYLVKDEAGTILDLSNTTITGLDSSLLAAGSYHSLALVKGGSVFAWGLNNHGQLGVSRVLGLPVTPPSLALAVAVDFPLDLGSATITKVAAGGSMSAALDSNGNAWIWGVKGVGQPDILIPLKVKADLAGLIDFTGVTDIAVGSAHVAVLKNDGTVWAWGFNGFGQLGNNSKTDSFVPVQVVSQSDPLAAVVPLTGVTEIRVFGNHTFAKAGGVWYGWGDNTNGQLGVSTASLTYALTARAVPAF